MNQQLTAVLPLRATGRGDEQDLERVKILIASLKQFAEPDLFSKFIIISPKAELDFIERTLQPMMPFELVVVDECELLPQLRKYPKMGGWTKQQLIKLAASTLVETVYFLTFDADVICTKPLSREILLPKGLGLVHKSNKQDHPHWWQASASCLNVDPKLTEPGIGVTPVILSTSVCRQLIHFLGQRQSGQDWIDFLWRPLRPFPLGWQRMFPHHKATYRWSEYSLYFLFLIENQLFDQYHIWGGTKSHPQTLVSSNSVWFKVDFNQWEAKTCFAKDDPALFCIIQSNKHLNIDNVRSKMRPYLDLV